jgi:ribosomal protein L11 methyltransferase
VKTWPVIDVVVTRDAREAAEYGLMEAGASGTETNDSDGGRLTVTAYFDQSPSVEAMRAGLLDALRIYDLSPGSLIELTAREIADQDWLAEWKKSWQPVEVGRFIIAPTWSEPFALRPDQILIRIDPGMAFGTGTHETTRLCLKAIEKYFAGGSFLDVGTGTGILAIAAAKSSPGSQTVACDTDADAVTIATENAAVNGVGDKIDFRVGTVDDSIASAEMVCANLTAPVIVELLPALLNATCGRLILSGILDSQFEMVNARLMEQAATVNEILQDGEWLALVI